MTQRLVRDNGHDSARDRRGREGTDRRRPVAAEPIRDGLDEWAHQDLDARFGRLELDERDGSSPLELFVLRERFVVRLRDEDEPLLLLVDRLRPLLEAPEDRLRPPDDLAAWARLPLPRREPLSSPDCESFFSSSPSDEVTSASSTVPRQAPDSSSFIIT
ncbi:MAG: hypothetical protein ACJ76G_08590 [Solirubrobacterales bacterium]